MKTLITTKELSHLNKELKTLEERLDYLNNEKYHVEVKAFYDSFSQSGNNLEPYKAIPIRYSIYLERDADYLLQVLPKETGSKRSLTSKDYDKKLKREYRKNNCNLDLLQPSSTGSPVKYTNTETIVTEEDLSNINYSSLLNEYEPYRKHLLKEQFKSKAGIGSYLPASQIARMLGNIQGDQMVIKKMKKGMFNFDSGAPKSKPYVLNDIDLDLIDYKNPNVIGELLSIVDFNEPIAPTNLSLIQYDLEVMVNTLHTSNKLKDLDIMIITMKQQGYNFTEISAKFGISKQAVSKRFNSIVNKICDYNKKNEGEQRF